MNEEFSGIQAATVQAEKAAIAKARARGEMHGFTGIFLVNFIERELQLMVKWRNRARAAGRGALLAAVVLLMCNRSSFIRFYYPRESTFCHSSHVDGFTKILTVRNTFFAFNAGLSVFVDLADGFRKI